MHSNLDFAGKLDLWRINPRMRVLVRALFLFTLLAGVAFILSGCSRGSDTRSASSGQKYYCPMHPTYVSDRPGDCPICNMKLVPIKQDKAAAKPAAAKTATNHVEVGQYYCAMCPTVVSNAPGICPACKMKLVQRTEADQASSHAEHETPARVPGRVRLMLSPEKRQMIGLTLSKVEMRPLAQTVRTVAVVDHDETRYMRIHPLLRLGPELSVNFTGAPVQKGEPLFKVYSPELFSTENEYLAAWKAAQATSAAPGSGELKPCLSPPGCGWICSRSGRKKFGSWSTAAKPARNCSSGPLFPGT
jgi:hypothetical protein